MCRNASAAATTNSGWVLIAVPGNEIYQIGLEDHGLTSDANWEEAKARSEDLVEVVGIFVHI
jgi:hypothetical protein